MTFQTINPATEDVVSNYSYFSDQTIDEKIERAYSAFNDWKTTSFDKKKHLLHTLARLLEDQKEQLGHLITIEMGKPLKQSVAEIEKCAWVCDYYAENGLNFLQNEQIKTEARLSYIHYAPLGPVLAIMPWNFPFWQVFRFAAPSLMAGNVALLKHSPNTTGCALAIEKLFKEAGFPEGAFTTLLADIPQIEPILANPKVKALTLTGSTKAGQSASQLAAKYLKKCVLELGGSDPYLILDDADLEKAAEICLSGRMLNTGQSCIAAKRFIVTKKRAVQFTELVAEKVKSYTYGDPEENHPLGTMARKDLRESLHRQVSESIAKGAKCLTGGQIPSGKGYFYPATLLTEVSKGMPAYDQELFGPVGAIITATDESDAVRIANDTSFGLGAAIITNDTDKAAHLAEQHLEFGAVFINDFVKSDPRLPFGGVKSSGYGRELSLLGIHEFVNAKTIYIK
ncbi:NAD-dependent succinate-semialdehyde dehydrogenase [Marinoscillum furvescens]|uniref:Succinate-semialdehyde dehydrogenase/glutarate-semialdehyde dehydrogenase n=1 Tax=Marinoscillum furvescens DSM 4134 TaxID=1122208 RepID=A0A3D9LGI1_MARFU|nr:NAD-dependent succinate-semialdehyde dehydrogenase [Marinoscillum furvescens]REE05717.1 succinate-semialdehyde dehydrogenase/glutarate-semialdehyde dehydrogenase [Marinoscillum furvescens DSM 4134]